MSSSRVLDPEPTMADLIESGRHFYANKNYERALVLFTKAMRSCPCSKDAKRFRRICKDFEIVAAQGGSIFKEAMDTCHCNVCRIFNQCENGYHMIHIQALEYRAAIFQALGELDHAMEEAEWILELAPRLPDGYLLVGKIAQLRAKDEYAWKMYTAGIEALKDSSVNSSPKLQQLYDARKPLNRRFFRQDPLYLPAELVTDIFSYLEWTELIVCLRVCKQWMRTLTSPLYCRLWRKMSFLKIPRFHKGRMSHPEQLKRMLSWAGDGGLRKILISPGGLTQADLTLLLKASPSLEYLEIWSLCEFSLPSREKIWSQLRQVDIENYEGRWLDPTAVDGTVDLPGQFPYRFLQNAASSLEHLTYTGVPEQWYSSEPSIPHLPKLKYLHIGGWNDRETPFSMFPLAIAFPQIEQLWIGPDVPNLDPGPMAHSQDKWEGVWPHLKVLIFDASIVEDIESVPLSGLRHLMCINRGNSLLHLLFVEILPDEGDADEIRDIFSNDDDRLPDFDVIRHSDFRNLRSVQSRSMWILPDRARTMLSNSLANGQLTSFDIGFPDHRHSIELPRGDLSVRHLKAYDWLRGAPSIHTLGCFGFDFRLDPKNDEYLPLPQFLATFPNLRTLRLAGQYEGENKNENENDFASLILAIMSVTHLKTIYMSSSEFQSDSYALRRVEEAAQSKGVQILTRWFYGEEMWPEQWPMPLES